MNLTTLYAVLDHIDTFKTRALLAVAQHQDLEGIPLGFPSKVNGALRRTSMELTRALADLRRPG
jgi:hypothetical protein